MSNDISNFSISPAINNRAQYNACGVGATDTLSQFNLGMYTSGELKTAGFSLQGANGLDINLNPVKTTRLWINELSSEVSFNVKSDEILTLESLTEDIQINGTMTLDKSTTLNLKTTISAGSALIEDTSNGTFGDPIYTQIEPQNIYMQNGNATNQTSNLTTTSLNFTNSDVGSSLTIDSGSISTTADLTLNTISKFNTNGLTLNDPAIPDQTATIAPYFLRLEQVSTLPATNLSSNIGFGQIDLSDTSSNALSLTPTTLTTNNGITINGLATFQTCPQTPVIPTLPDDLVNLNYIKNNPPASAVIFYLNNSLTPTPPISTYRLLGSQEDNLAQSSINTSISGIGTVSNIQSFANQLDNLNAGSFIPSGIWDLNVFPRAVLSSDIGHISLYFQIFGKPLVGIEVQIGTDSSVVPVSTTTIEQIKLTLALPYIDISSYDSLIIKLYAINNRSGQTDITTYYEGTTTYSHLHTTFGIYVPPSLLGTNNTWTGVNTFSQNIIGNLTGNASTATSSTSASTVTIIDDNVNAVNYLVFAGNNTGNLPLKVDKTTNPLSYNPLTGVLTSTNFTGALTGTASSATNTNNTLTGTSNTTVINLVGGVTKALTYQQLFMGNTLPLTYDTSIGLLTTPSLIYKEISRQSQSPASGSTLNFTLGSLIIDASATASTFIFPIYTASNTGAEIAIQKTSATNHNCVITAGLGNQIASVAANVLGSTFTMTNNIYQQSFRFINPNWFPF